MVLASTWFWPDCSLGLGGPQKTNTHQNFAFVENKKNTRTRQPSARWKLQASQRHLPREVGGLPPAAWTAARSESDQGATSIVSCSGRARTHTTRPRSPSHTKCGPLLLVFLRAVGWTKNRSATGTLCAASAHRHDMAWTVWQWASAAAPSGDAPN